MKPSSSSSSSPPPSGPFSWFSIDKAYDVFLSFRGEDTRRTFTDHLYAALERAGVWTFRDAEGLRAGEDISWVLERTIKQCKISLIVFSENYADSSWCLEELVQIMECKRTQRQLVFPIFYHVDPSHVRKQKGSFGTAFVKHEAALLDTERREMLARWKAALGEAASLTGFHIADGHEAEFINRIVEEICRHLTSTYLYLTDFPVGIDSRVEEISQCLGVGLDDDVRMVGIWGMGGIGKTTVAKAIYNKFYRDFDSKSFLEDVRETAKDSKRKIALQERLLSDVLKPTKILVGDVSRGINVIRERLGRKKVLVIVDDVDHEDQLNALAIRHDSFGPGSRIIITTRNRHVLELLQVDKIHFTREMEVEEALELFSWHAFRNHSPDEDYLDLSRSVVTYCGGLPLALEVIGSFLFKRSVKDWESTLNKLKKIPHVTVQSKLRISFDAMYESQKNIFLHICCFFIGMDKENVTRILISCGFAPDIEISVLLQRCLVTVSEKNKLMMHDLLRDMGREVVREESPNHPERRSRLWYEEDVKDVLTDESGTEDTEGLALNLQRSDNMCVSTQAFRNMKSLKFLQLNNVKLTGDCDKFPRKLRWLCLRGFSEQVIRNEFLDEPNLVSIDLRYSNLIRIWEDSRLLWNLEFLNLSHSHYLTQSPDFSQLPNLKYLFLKDCVSLPEIDKSIGLLHHLVLLNLKGCTMLKDLPEEFYNFRALALTTLVLSGCSRFQNLSYGIGNFSSLKTLVISGTAISEVPSSVDNLPLDYSSRQGLRGLPRSSKDDMSVLRIRAGTTSTYLYVTTYPVGIDSRVEEISQCLGVGLDDDVRMVGIWGMGGIGKTTIAKAIYKKFYHDFDSRSFLEDVRETAKDSKGKIALQEKLLSDVLKPAQIPVGNVSRGINVIRELLGRKKVLVIVDDVDHVDQLNALAIRRESFGPGSRIIITTRDRHILELLKVDTVHLTEVMNEEEGLELFSWHAFQNHSPDEDYFELSKRVVKYCGGLPLALQVLGSFLCSRSLIQWESTLEKLGRNPDATIQSRLRISFDAIDESQKNIFLHICCFFIGMDKESVSLILGACGFYPVIGISILQQRCLVTVNEKNKLMVHDLLRDMGREVVCEESPNHPEERSRLWRPEDVIDVLTDESGTAKTVGLSLNRQRSDLMCVNTQAFRNMRNLNLLQLNYVQLTGRQCDKFPRKLRWLCLRGFSGQVIRNEFLDQPNLVSIDLRYSNLIRIWEDSERLRQLEFLNLSHSHYLTQSPDFSQLPKLKYLILKDCVSLPEIDKSIGSLSYLVLLNLKGCTMLKDLPEEFYEWKPGFRPAIKTLVLSGCSRFQNLSYNIGNLYVLRTLDISGTAISEVPSSVDNLPLDYSSRQGLRGLPRRS